MIVCPVCGTENDNLAVTCMECRSYLQGKVDNLNLFGTVWGLIESPRATLRRIVLARHKNYVLFLSALFGIALVYGLIWFKKLGNRITDPALIMGIGLLAGPVAGIACAFLLGGALAALSRLYGGKAGFRNAHALVAYASVPVILSLVFVFPVELAVFGRDFFGTNPHPMVVAPITYLMLIGLDALCIIWGWILLAEGALIASSVTRLRAFLMVVTLLVLTGIGTIAAYLI